LIAAGIGVLILGVMLALLLSSRRLYVLDQTRTAITQNLQTTFTMLGADIRQAGEGFIQVGAQFNGSIRPLVVTDGGAGPDTIALRTRVQSITTQLPVCATATSTTIMVAQAGSALPVCIPADANTNGVPDNLEAWEAYRLAQGGSVRAYIYNQLTQQGQFFTYSGSTGSNATAWYITGTGGALSGTYTVGAIPLQLWLLEERTYSLDTATGRLMLSVNGGTPQPVVDRVADFQVQTLQASGTPWTPANLLSQLAVVRVTLQGQANVAGGGLVNRTLKADFFPRNLLAQQ